MNVKSKHILGSLLAVTVTVLTFTGCLGEQIEENRRMLEQQQAEISAQQKQIASLVANPRSYSTAPPAGGCDREVMAIATRRGGESFAAGDFAKAQAYYRDALSACPNSAEAKANLERAEQAARAKP